MRHIQKACELIDNDYNHVLEFGVYRGETISMVRAALPEKYKIFGFDSFEGLPEDWVDQSGNVAGGGVCRKGFFSTGGGIPNVDGVTFFKGWFDATVNDYLKIAEPISLLHVDCDLYSSTKTILYNLNDYIKANTIIVFDEWFYNQNPSFNDHEQKCFYEWVKDFNREFEFIEHHCPTSANEQKIVKILK